MQNYDVCVIGSGPAGMKAAVQCADAGASVLLLDEQPAPGGQIYRAVGTGDHPAGKRLGPDYLHGATLVHQLEQSLSSAQSGLTYVNEATVWRVDTDKHVYWSRRNQSQVVRARQIIIATGATERSFPFPGWTLPGIMTAGAGQILMKTAHTLPRQAVLAGTGPLLYLLAAQMIDAGVPPLALVDTHQPQNYLKAARYAGGALLGYRYLLKGLRLLRKIRRAGVLHFTRATGLRATGRHQIEALSFRSGSTAHMLKTSALLCHVGVIPNVQLTRAIGVKHQWDQQQHCWKPILSSHGFTTIDGISVAGDNGGIGGAIVAELQGELTAIEVLQALQIKVPDQKNRRAELSRQIQKELAVRPFLDALYTPPAEALNPTDETIVCRCEEVTAGAVRALARQGSNGINQIKAMTRCGMGPCQGRYCGAAVSELIASETGQTPAQVGYYRIRHPVKPLTLGELASLTPAHQSLMNPYRKKEPEYDANPAPVYESTHE